MKTVGRQALLSRRPSLVLEAGDREGKPTRIAPKASDRNSQLIIDLSGPVPTIRMGDDLRLDVADKLDVTASVWSNSSMSIDFFYKTGSTVNG